ncbi:MAG TPA: hypothetical protein VM009_07010 [Terriglobales bacterium]|nr:hypothetical protein [Terriglobales bacterium]
MKFPLISRLLVLLCLATSLQAQQMSMQIRAEVTRLQQEAQAKPDSDSKTGLLRTLKRAELASTAHRDYLALEELATAHIMAQVLRDEELKLDPATGMKQFESEYQRVMPEMLDADKRARSRTWNNVPEAIRAIAEISQSKTLVLMEATRPYAMATGAESGIVYIGQARATVRTSDFAASLKVSTPAKPKLRSILPELQSLQTRVNAAFKPPKSIARHSDFIRLNASLKMAFELDAARLYAGAMYRYLEALRLVEMMDASFKQEDVTLFAEKSRNKLRSSKRDNSLAELFLQKADAFQQGRDGSPPSADDLMNAIVIHQKVLPAYFAVQESEPARIATHEKPKTITVTLVRWPYT